MHIVSSLEIIISLFNIFTITCTYYDLIFLFSEYESRFKGNASFREPHRVTSKLTSLEQFLGAKDNPITRGQILDSSKLKEFADDYFKFDENGSKLSRRVEKIVGNGEIAHYE